MRYNNFTLNFSSFFVETYSMIPGVALASALLRECREWSLVNGQFIYKIQNGIIGIRAVGSDSEIYHGGTETQKNMVKIARSVKRRSDPFTKEPY